MRADRSRLLLFLLMVISSPLLAQSSNPCDDATAQRAWASANNPVYSDAMQLAGILTDHGVLVECIRGSKEGQVFEGQKGAAWFKTSQGVFDVLFLPMSQNFEGLDVVAKQETYGRYRYSFQGSPHTSATIDSAKPIVFIKHKNLMVEVWDNEKLAKQLTRIFRTP